MTITINRPARRNAVNQEARAIIRSAIDTLETDTTFRVGVLTGASTAFCAGMDLAESRAGVASRLGGADGGFAGFARYPRTKPVIAAVNGAALGGGFELVLACDLVLAVPDAWFALPEPARGIIPGGGGAVRLPQQLPRVVANEVLLAGRRLTAADAERWGVINRVVDSGNLLREAHALAASITASAPLAVTGTLATADAARRFLEGAAWDVNDANVRFIRTTEDAREGAAAFVEKRLPRWAGR
jgi:enoyl-CoA hydratase/carnithine racemase